MDPLEDILETVQKDTFERLSATPSLQGINIIMEDENSLDSRVELIAGKQSGLCIVVLRADVIEAEKNLPGPTFSVRQEIQIIEHPGINGSSKGHKVRCGTVAIRVLRSLHLATLGNSTIHSAKNPVKAFPVRDSYVSSLVSVTARPESAFVDKPASVAAEIIEDALVLSCGTPDTQIFYSSDGSYPRAGSGNSQIYTDPITDLTLGSLIRAAAYAPGLNPGDVANIKINPS